MFITVSRENDKWVVDLSIAAIYPEFRAILDDPKLGSDVMAYVALGCDTSSDNPLGESFENDNDRLAEAARCVFGEDEQITTNPKVYEAVNKYIQLVDTPASRSWKSLNDSLKNVGNYLQTEGAVLNKDNIGAYVGTLKTLQEILSGIKKLNKPPKKEKEVDEKELEIMPGKRIRADKQLGYSARKYIKKNLV